MQSLRPLAATFAACLALAFGGCAGDDDGTPSESPAPAPEPPPPARGTVIGTPSRVASYSTSDLLSRLGANRLARELANAALSPTCDVDVWRVEYATVGGRDEATQATTAVMVPKGSDARCSGARPLIAYAHGTSVDARYDMSALDAAESAESVLVAAAFAADGYVVVAPNYAGYAGSTLDYHPYLVADQQSKDTIDAIAAARASAGTTGASLDARLYLTGYSQGGYVAMATHRALEAAGTAVTASVPMSGPYALAAFGDAIFMGRPNLSAVPNFALLASAYQRSYGTLYANATDLYDAKYAASAAEALPASATAAELVTQGVLPANALFSSTPPSDRYAAMTPATDPAALAPVYARGFGDDFLVANAYRAAYLDDALAHPDGSFPTPTDDQAAAAPAHELRRRLKQNDLRTWTPVAPTLLCGGDADPTVYWLNTEAMQRYWARVAPAAPVAVLDVDAGADDGYGDVRDAFALAKAAVRLDGGDEAVRDAYHAGLVAPACLAAARRFIAAH